MGDEYEPLSISWSSLRSFSECRQKGYLKKTGHEGRSKNIRPYYHGVIADVAMRRWLADPDLPPGGMEAMIEELVVSEAKEAKESGDGIVRWKSSTDKAEMTEYCKELARRLEPILEDRVLSKQFLSAWRFKVLVQVPWLDGSPTCIYLNGELDLLTYDEVSGYEVLDLKATKDPDYWRKTVGQLVFYDVVVGAMFEQNTSKTALIQPMIQSDPVLEFVISDDDRAQMWARIHRMTTDLWLKDYRPKDNTVGCSMCEVKHACSRYKDAEFIDRRGHRRMRLGG